jgi:hypothetical protein
MSPALPLAIATRICVTQSGCDGQPGMLITGNPHFDLKWGPRKPPRSRFRYCSPIESEGFGAVAGMPPQQAQSPRATTALATPVSSATQSFIGRSANML